MPQFCLITLVLYLPAGKERLNQYLKQGQYTQKQQALQWWPSFTTLTSVTSASALPALSGLNSFSFSLPSPEACDKQSERCTLTQNQSLFPHLYKPNHLFLTWVNWNLSDTNYLTIPGWQLIRMRFLDKLCAEADTFLQACAWTKPK
jgi:hypothetical protein